jgi:hypothetical protein
MITLTPDHITQLMAGETVELDGVKIIMQHDGHFATGAEIKSFYFDHWDDDYYYESGGTDVPLEDEEGKWIAQDDRLYDLRELGTLEGKARSISFEDAFNAWKARQEYEITINGKKCMRRSPQSYHSIVGEGPTLVTVMYSNAPGNKQGSLLPGQSTAIQTGTIFDAVVTDNA